MGRKVLVVDDDILVAGFMSDCLDRLGHETQEAYSGQDALEALDQDDSFDLVITDVAMPGMTGYELSAQIKILWPSLQIALVTANPSGTGLDDDPMHMLPKPYSREELRSLLDKLTADEVGTTTHANVSLRSRSERIVQAALS